MKILITTFIIFSLLLTSCSNNSKNRSEIVVNTSSIPIITQTSNETESKTDTTSNPTQSTVLTENARSLGMTNDMFDNSIVHNSTDDIRLANVMKKAQTGEPITIGFIGGSITQGAAATSDSKTYARQVYNWWAKKFPKSEVSFINAGIGATDSVLGVHRIAKDLLTKNPDFVIVEFAVNDGKTFIFKETYENVIRRIINESQNPAVLLLFMMTEQGDNAQNSEIEVGNHYGLPMISYKDALWPSISTNSLKWTDISPDNIHPNDRGHSIAGELVNNYLDRVFNNLSSIPTKLKPIPEPLVSDSFMNAKLFSSKTITVDSLGSFEIDNNAFWQFSDGWTSKEGTQPMRITVKAKIIFLLIKKTNSGNGGKASIKVNGKEITTINSDFPNGWGDYAKPILICYNEDSIKQIIEISLLPEAEKDEFTILGILAS